MVNLPKPSFFSNSAGIEVLPRTSPIHHVPPSSASPCCYRFGLTTLPQDAEASQTDDLRKTLSELFTLSRLLSIPSLFGRGDGQAWTHSEEHYPALLQWREQHVPSLLSRVALLLGKLNASTLSQEEDSAETSLVLGHVVCAVSRYLPPIFTGSGKPSDSSASNVVEMDDGWISLASQSTAKNILSNLRTPTPSIHTIGPSNIARALLADYIKPIFRETASSSSGSTSAIDPTTGRKKAPAAGSDLVSHLDTHLGQHRFQSADEDNDASNFAPTRFRFPVSAESMRCSAEKLGLTQGAEQSLMERNEALGCVNVLAWCMDNLQLKSEGDWSSVWPLVVPPLLTLMEHPQPRFRVRGAVLAHRLLLWPSLNQDGDDGDGPDVSRRETALANMLIRTGIGSLLEQALHVNLTFIHDETYAPSLLSHSIGALRQLILITTHPIAYRDPGQQSFDPPSILKDTTTSHSVTGLTLDKPDDCGERRHEALNRLVSESILSSWSYLPLPPSSTRLGRELVNVTCSAYLTLIDDLTPPAFGGGGIGGVSRFLDVSLDWIFRSWMSNVGFDHTDQMPSTMAVLNLAGRLLFSRDTKQRLGSTTRFTSLILSSVAKCFISALESPLRTSTIRTEASGQAEWTELEKHLSEFLVSLARIDTSVEERWKELVGLDQRLGVLVTSQR
ncbi:uncharacterized protein UTRI_01618_B [Ustilago trichophora]|uniref:Uncharacterized protein n=1 Tax=Ustilago trichophora TaxID=86804 RepID=A0A5C3E2D5_9BASI|nr:uncharacterized protein UTRI_01618_B [Ustilago trichophora]